MIEDIDYLKKHSMKESYVLLIDSKYRDKRIHRTPENYKINFESPFTHVYSVEVLDASIPRTQYSVDEHNNKLRLNAYKLTTKSKYTYLDVPNFITLTIPIGDYNDTTLITKVNEIFNENNIDMLLRNVSSPSNVKSTFEFVSPHKFELDMHSSTLNTVLGFDMYNTSESYRNFSKSAHHDYEDMFITDTRYSTTFENRWFGSILSETDNITFTAYESPTNLGDNYGNSSGISISIIQPFKIGNDVYDSGYVESIKIEILEGTYSWSIYDVVNNEDSSTTKNVVNLTQTQLLDDKDYELHITFSDIFTVNVNTDVDDSKAVTNNAGVKLKLNESNFELNFEVILHKKLHKVVAPGMHNLLGERYLMLRCKEIEDHLFKFRAYESYSMGMAKFKLSVQGFEDERFDFSSIPPREFHPIGKLPCLSFEFLNPDGSYYNFRGINHTLTLIIRYYTPTQDPTLFKSKLNPEYDPDIFKYIQEKGFNTDSDNDSDSASDTV